MKKAVAYLMVGIFLGTSPLWVKNSNGSEYDRGKKLFNDKCLMCHGADGKGNGPAAAAFNPKPADFTDPKFWQWKDIDKSITDTVENGRGMMPAFNLKPGEIKAIIDYFSQAFKK